MENKGIVPNTPIKNFFLKRAITVEEDKSIHRRTLRNAFLAATIYSVAYGIWEYFVVYDTIRLVDILGPEINWAIMYSGLIITVALASRLSIEKTVLGLFHMAMLEDVVYWMCHWAKTQEFPYPAGNWWDSYFASYRVLGGWGQSVPFWPWVPIYYFPGFAMVITYYLLAYKGAIYGRISAWMIGPLFLAIIGGTMVDDLAATYILIFLPIGLLFYAFIITLYSYRRLENKSDSDS